MNIITGRAPPSHEPIRIAPGLVFGFFGLNLLFENSETTATATAPVVWLPQNHHGVAMIYGRQWSLNQAAMQSISRRAYASGSIAEIPVGSLRRMVDLTKASVRFKLDHS